MGSHSSCQLIHSTFTGIIFSLDAGCWGVSSSMHRFCCVPRIRQGARRILSTGQHHRRCKTTAIRRIKVTQRSRRRGRSTIHIGLLGGALVFFAIGTFLLWNQHSGVPARMTVESCTASKTGTLHSHGDVVFPLCYGRPSGAPDQPFTDIWGAWWRDAGHDINVHILGSGTGATAIKDSWWQPLTGLAIGCVLGVGGVRAIVRRLRRAPPVTAESIRRPASM
jgi:hypothetical protein